MNEHNSDAIPFILMDNNIMKVSEQVHIILIYIKAKEFLLAQPIKQKLGVISVVGKYRTGKSYFINKGLLEDTSAFKVGKNIYSKFCIIFIS